MTYRWCMVPNTRCHFAKKKTKKKELLSKHQFENLEDSCRALDFVIQQLNVLKKTFYDFQPVSNKQMSLMPMANGGIGFCKYEAKNLWTILLLHWISYGRPKQNCCDVTNFHQVATQPRSQGPLSTSRNRTLGTRLFATVASASFQSSLFYYP